ncbi:MAG TPA: hypothetical protein RMH80_01950, partial [Polyangiaceae bacterium LLY-WYZ-15_(1-7)]|nr:hypothetical protein [Polyangiaceae bacterium LLY-WYZ-15_(1-7)]
MRAPDGVPGGLLGLREERVVPGEVPEADGAEKKDWVPMGEGTKGRVINLTVKPTDNTMADFVWPVTVTAKVPNICS